MRNLITSVGMLSSGLSKITLRNNGWECSSYKKNTQSLPGCAGGGGQTKSTHGGYLGCFKVDTGTGLDLNIYTSVTVTGDKITFNSYKLISSTIINSIINNFVLLWWFYCNLLLIYYI